MPSWELFEKQDKKYQDSVIPPNVKARVGIEAGVELGWHKWLGEKGIFIGMSSSAPQRHTKSASRNSASQRRML